MSLDNMIVTIETEEIEITVDEISDTEVILKSSPDVIILATGGLGQKGDQGEVGPEGPQGAQGAPGSAVGSAHYEWKVSTAATDPAHGFIKANNADATLYTEFYASVYSKENAVVRFDLLEIDGEFWIYEHGQLNTWNKYKLTAPVVNHDNEWFTIPCVFVESGAFPFTPGGNTQVEVTTPVMGEQGPEGPMGPPGPSYTLPARLGPSVTVSAAPGDNANNATESGWYYVSVSGTNKPGATDWYLEVMGYSSSFGVQHAHAFYTNETWRRIQNSGVWSAWEKIWPAAAPAAVLPIGAMLMWPTEVAAPTGFMKADGSAIPVGLTEAISKLGANVPDMRGRSPFGVDTGLALYANDGQAAGSRGPTHKHTFTQPTISAPGHALTLPNHLHSFTNPTVNSHSHGGGVHTHGITDNGHAHQVYTEAGGSPNPGNYRVGRSDNNSSMLQTQFTSMTSVGTGIGINNSAATISAETPGTSGGSVGNPTSLPAVAGTINAPVATGGAAGPGASSLIDKVGHLATYFIIYVGT